MDDKYPALTDEEIQVVSRASRAKRFETYTWWGYTNQVAAVVAYMGGLGAFSNLNRMPRLYSHFRQILTKRTLSSYQRLLDRGEPDRALALYADIKTICGRIQTEGRNWITHLVAHAIVGSSHRVIQKYLLGATRRDLLNECLKQQEVAIRQEFHFSCLIDDWVTLEQLPLQRFIRTRLEIESHPERLEKAYRRELKLNRRKYYDEAMENLVWLAGDKPWSFALHHLVILGDLRDPKAIPELEKLAHSTDPLVAYLVKKAITNIRDNP